MVMPNKPAPVAQTPAQIAELSPQERQQYFTDQANAGVHDPGFIGMVERLVAQTKAKNDAERVGNENVKDLQTEDVQYVKGLDPSDADYLGHEHEQLKAYLDTNLDPKQVTDVSNAYHQLHEAFDGFGTAMTEAVNKSKGEWEGDAAGNAQGYFTSLGKWADANSVNAKLASETIYDQQTAASNAKNTMPEVVKFDMSDEMAKWGQAKDPLSFADAIQNTYKTYEASNKAHEEAAGVMSQYDKTLYAAASKQPAFAPPPKFGQGEVGTLTPPGKTEPSGTGKGTGDENSSSNNLTGGGSHLQGGGGTGTGTGGGGGGGGTNLPPTHTPLQPGGPSTGSGTLPGFTAPAGFQQSNLPPSNANSNANANTGMGGMGAMPMGGMGMGGGMGGDSEYNNKTGRGGGGFGPGGGGSGSGSTPGAGSSSGARAGGVGAAEAAAGRGIGAGGSGMGGRGSGMGGMGKPGGGKAEGEEDLEHQRPDYLVEGDPDEFFGTDMRTAPPVIGE